MIGVQIRGLAIAAVLVGGLSSGLARAQSDDAAQRQQAATKLYEYVVELGMMDQVIDGLTPLFIQQFNQVIAQKGLTVSDRVRHAILDIVKDETLATFDELKPQIISAYATTLTMPELQKSLELYESPEGRSMMAKMQTLSTSISNIMLPQMGVMQQRTMKRVIDEVGPMIEAEQKPK